MLPIVNSLKEATNAFYRNSTATLWAKREDGTEKQVSSLKEAKLFYGKIEQKKDILKRLNNRFDGFLTPVNF